MLLCQKLGQTLFGHKFEKTRGEINRSLCVISSCNRYLLLDEITALRNLINPFPKQSVVFMCLQYKSFKNTVGIGEIARNEQFLLFK